MTTDTTRRSIIAGLAAAPVAAIPAIAANDGLESLIEQHSVAHATWEAAIAHADGRDEPMIETGLGSRFGIRGYMVASSTVKSAMLSSGRSRRREEPMAEALTMIDILDRLDDLVADARALEMAMLGAQSIDEGESRALNRLTDKLTDAVTALHRELDAQHEAEKEAQR